MTTRHSMPFAVTLALSWSAAASAQPTATVDACIDDHVAFQEHELEGSQDMARAAARRCSVVACPEIIRRECTAAAERLAAASETTPPPDDDGRARDEDETVAPPIVSESIPAPKPPNDRRDTAGPSFELALTIGGYGLAGAGLAVFAAAGGVALHRRSELEKACGGTRCPDDHASYLNGGRAAGHAATAGAVAGLVGAAAGTVGLILLLGDDEREIAVGIDTHSIALKGRF